MIVAACFALIIFIGKNIQSELAPLEDKGSVRITMTGAEGMSYDDMRSDLLKAIRIMQDSFPEQAFTWGSVPGYGGSSGNSSASGRLGLVRKDERTRTQSEIAADLNKKMKRFKNVRVFAIEEQTISVGMMSRGSLPVQFIIQNLDFQKIRNVIPQILEAARKDKTFQNVDVNLKFNKPEYDLSIDRMRVRDLGLNTADVAQALQAAFSGARSAYFIMNDRQYQVITQVPRTDRNTPTDIDKIYVRNNRGEQIPISSVLTVEENSNPPNLYHYNRFNSATISASLADGKTIGDGVKAMERIAKEKADKEAENIAENIAIAKKENKEVKESRISTLKPDEIGYLKIANFKENGVAAETKVVGTILEVTLPQPIVPKQTVSFTLDFDGQVPLQIRRSGRNSEENVALSMTQWYPKMAEYDFEGWQADPYIGREFHGVWGNFDVKITIDKDYTIGGTGYLQNKNEIGKGYEDIGVQVVYPKKAKTLIWHFVAPNVHDFAWGADKEYIHDKIMGENNVELHFFYKNKPENIENWKKFQPKTAELLAFFNKHVGPYPYKQYSVVQGGDGGMEYAMCTLITGNRSYGSLVGCTGGKHRSVAITQELNRRLTNGGFLPGRSIQTKAMHRDLGREI